MTTLAVALKKDLKQNFKDIKFSVTTKRNNVSVAWEMTLGTVATKQAVKEICKKHETVQYHGSSIDDTAWSSGTSVYYHPSYTQEMKDSAVAGVIDHKFADATWDDRYERFLQTDGMEHSQATKLYYYYVENGVASQLIDECGSEPSDKRWYYEKLNTPAPTPEPGQGKPEVEAPIIPIAVYPIEGEVCIDANFPNGNKRHCIDEYRSQATNLCQAKIVKAVHLATEDYQTFLHSLLDTQDWLAGEGESSSHYISEKYGDDYDKLFCDELEAKKWRRGVYKLSTLVTDGKHYTLANPEGCNYARYVGLQHYATLKWVLEKCGVELFPAPAPVELEPVLQPEPDSAPDCINLYQEWVITLVSEGRCTEIISYQEWNRLEEEETALESEVSKLQQRLIALQQLKRSKTNR